MAAKRFAVCVLVIGTGAFLLADSAPVHDPAGGRRLLTSSITVSESPGFDSSTMALANTYDATGNLLSSVRTFDFDNDGVADSRSTETNTYDATGHVSVRVTAADFGGDGVIEWLQTDTYTYDNRGNLTLFESAGDSGGDGNIDLRRSVATVFNAASKPLEERFEDDFDNDGLIDSVVVRTNTYGNRGDLLSSTSKFYDAGGILLSSDNRSHVYEASGRLVMTVDDSDFDANGTVDQHTTITSTYDAQGNVVSLVMVQSLDAASDPYYIESWTREYDNHGNVLKETNERDYDADGIDISGSITINTYDAQGHILTYVSESFGFTFVERQTMEYTYEVTGNLAETVNNFWFDGVLSSTTTTTNQY